MSSSPSSASSASSPFRSARTTSSSESSPKAKPVAAGLDDGASDGASRRRGGAAAPWIWSTPTATTHGARGADCSRAQLGQADGASWYAWAVASSPARAKKFILVRGSLMRAGRRTRVYDDLDAARGAVRVPRGSRRAARTARRVFVCGRARSSSTAVRPRPQAAGVIFVLDRGSSSTRFISMLASILLFAASEPTVVVKLGGSAVTRKDKFETLNQRVLATTAQQLRATRGSAVLVHGCGSFGHFQAHEFGIAKGTVAPNLQLARLCQDAQIGDEAQRAGPRRAHRCRPARRPLRAVSALAQARRRANARVRKGRRRPVPRAAARRAAAGLARRFGARRCARLRHPLGRRAARGALRRTAAETRRVPHRRCWRLR